MDAVVLIVAFGFGLMGVAGLVRPPVVIAPVGGTADSPDTRSEVRAVYGGFGIAMAGALVYAALSEHGSIRDGILLTVGVALAGMAVGRVVGFLVERPWRFHPTVTIGLLEAAAGASLLVVAALD